MNNITKISAILMISGFAAACSSGGGETTKTGAAVETKSASFDKVFSVKQDESMISWEGYKPTGQHYGTVAIADGAIKAKDGVLAGGQFTFDMNSITVLDLTDPEWNGKLTGHLKSADFFEVDAFPKATFEITGIQAIDPATVDMSKEKGDIVPSHAITGNLTMKGITKSITFNALLNQTENSLTAESNMFFIDRLEWNIQFKSKTISAKFKDDFINDEMGIKLKVVAVEKAEGMAAL
jgi:polyisoprenoid-binding protein YceI